MKQNDNTIKETSEKYDFDKLLDEFINTELQSVGNEDEIIADETAFNYAGSTYNTKVFDNECICPLKSIEVELNGCIALHESGKNRLFTNRKGSKEIHANIQIDRESCMEPTTLWVSLYEKGNPVALASAESGTVEMLRSYPVLLQVGEKLEPGAYFIYVHHTKPVNGSVLEGVEDGVCYPFEVLLDGSCVKRPVLVGCHASWTGGKKGGLWHRNPIWITTLLRDIPDTGCELALLCYNRDLSLAGQSFAYCSSYAGSSSQKISFSIGGQKAWLPGTYSAVLALNRFPFGLLLITLDEEGTIQCHRKPMDKEDYLFRVVREMEFIKCPLWHITRELSGVRQEKRKLLALYEERTKAVSKGTRMGGELFIFTAPFDFWANRTAYSMRNELGIGRKRVAVIDLGKREEGYQDRMEQFLEDRKDKAFIFFHADKLLSPQNNSLMSAVVQSVLHPEEGTTLVLCFNDDALSTFERLCPDITGFAHRNHIIRVQKHSKGECIRDLLYAAEKEGLVLEEETIGVIAHAVVCNWEVYGLGDWTDYAGWLEGIVKPAVCKRLNLQTWVREEPKRLWQEDLRLEEYWERLPQEKAILELETERRRFEESMKELNNLVGLENLKKGMSDLFVKVQFNKLRSKLGLPEDSEAPRHLLFTGNPGTGKTTVAKLLGKIYKEMGLLSHGEVIVTERTRLVGSYIGHTEENMRETLEKAKGNVLFIDEAYTLCDTTDDRRDFGNRVIESLLTVLAEPHPDMVVVLAGYGDEMQRMLKMNQGLKSRFSFSYEFEDYTAEQLFQIAVSYLNRFKYVLAKKAGDIFMEVIEKAVACKDKNFGNARWVKQLVDNHILPAMARRVMTCGKPLDLDLCMQIEAEDVRSIEESSFLKVIQEKKRIGFR